jgi:hypothetical protein
MRGAQPPLQYAKPRASCQLQYGSELTNRSVLLFYIITRSLMPLESRGNRGKGHGSEQFHERGNSPFHSSSGRTRFVTPTVRPPHYPYKILRSVRHLKIRKTVSGPIVVCLVLVDRTPRSCTVGRTKDV